MLLGESIFVLSFHFFTRCPMLLDFLLNNPAVLVIVRVRKVKGATGDEHQGDKHDETKSRVEKRRPIYDRFKGFPAVSRWFHRWFDRAVDRIVECLRERN